MLASANIFESLSDIDSKFSKVIDREYELISNEVKKWFKKLSVRWPSHKFGNNLLIVLCLLERRKGPRRENGLCKRKNQAGWSVSLSCLCYRTDKCGFFKDKYMRRNRRRRSMLVRNTHGI